MKNGFLLFIIGIGLQFMASVSEAQQDATLPGILLFPTFSIQQQAGTLAGDQTVTTFDIRAGYRIPSGLFFGMIYSNTSGSGTTSISNAAFGNSIGYTLGLFSIVTSFYLSAITSESNGATSLKRSEGLGFQLDLAYTFPLGSGFYLGPVLTYKSLSYNKKQDANGVVTSSSQSETFFNPYLGLVFVF